MIILCRIWKESKTVKMENFMRYLIILCFLLMATSGFTQEKSWDDQQEDSDLPLPTSNSGGPFGMGFSVGAVTIDNQIYTQIALMPELVLGKFGMALDLRLFIDSDGNIREENWDSFNDILEKIYYVRWGLKGDPFYVRAGAINNYRLGYGLLMNKYYNTIEYPSVIRTGMLIGVDTGGLVVDLMLNDFKELGKKQGGVFAGRIGYRFLGDLEIGGSVVYDRNQYATMRDADGDGVSDDFDDFPTNGAFVIDTDGDGVPDSIDPDRDGNGYTDNSQDPLISDNDIYFDPRFLKPNPFTIQNAPDRDQIAFAADIGFPFINKKQLQLIAYLQAAKFGYGGGWGYTLPGIRGKAAFINFFGEFRIQEPKFLPEYFSTTYEIERVNVLQDSLGNLYPTTKRQYLQAINTRLKGFVIGADFNLWGVMIFGADYQRLSGTRVNPLPGEDAAVRISTLRMSLDLNTDFVPKFKKAGAYFYQQNADDLFTRTEGTVMGARISYEIAAGAALVIDYRMTFKDLNGDGEISGPGETLKTSNIQTVFMF